MSPAATKFGRAQPMPASLQLGGLNPAPQGFAHAANPISNRNTLRFESSLSHTKQSPAKFLIATFRDFSSNPRANFRSPRHSRSRALAASWQSRIAARAAASPCQRPPAPPRASNRPAKLEIPVSSFDSVSSLFLIDNLCRLLTSDAAATPSGTVLSHLRGRSRICSALKLLENLLTALKSATSHFIIDNFLPLLRFAFASQSKFLQPFPCKGIQRL